MRRRWQVPMNIRLLCTYKLKIISIQIWIAQSHAVEFVQMMLWPCPDECPAHHCTCCRRLFQATGSRRGHPGSVTAAAEHPSCWCDAAEIPARWAEVAALPPTTCRYSKPGLPAMAPRRWTAPWPPEIPYPPRSQWLLRAVARRD
jgi:hypothetical protein